MKNKCIEYREELQLLGEIFFGADGITTYACYFPPCKRYGLITTVSKP